MKTVKALPALILTAGLFLGGCTAKKEVSAAKTETPVLTATPKVVDGESRAVAKASIFRMNGPYSNNVAITLNADGSLAYYPDPTDIKDSSSPYDLGNGWYLDRQGIGSNSVFTRYTFDEYRKLPAPPSHEELLEAVIPGAGVTEIVSLPLDYSEALRNPELCRQYIP